MSRVAVAMSGGLDSLCALYLLIRQGASCFALHAVLAPNASPPIGLEAICSRLGAPLHILDLRSIFSIHVIDHYHSELAALRTPNPCAICNRTIKFDALLDAAMTLGAQSLATGHYCSLLQHPETRLPLLGRPADIHKNQGYFLSLVKPQALKNVIFPLAEYTKDQCREIIGRAGMKAPLARESQDICFLADRPAASAPGTPGPIRYRDAASMQAALEELPVIGTHAGLAKYTIGQRKGLNIAWREPLYALEMAADANTLVAGPRQLLNMLYLRAANANYFIPHEFWPKNLFAQARYRQRPVPCAVRAEKDSLQIWPLRQMPPSAPGQTVAILDDSGSILAGGIIDEIRYGPEPPLV